MNDEERQVLMDSLKDDQQRKREADELANEKWRARRGAELVAKKSPVEEGTTNISAPSLSATAQERRIQKEGQDNIGRDPEEVAIGERRSDWDPKKTG